MTISPALRRARDEIKRLKDANRRMEMMLGHNGRGYCTSPAECLATVSMAEKGRLTLEKLTYVPPIVEDGKGEE